MAVTELSPAPPAAAPAVHLDAGWSPRPRLAAAMGVAWYVANVAISLSVTSFVAHAIRPPDHVLGLLAWLAGLTAAAAVSLEASQRLTRRLLTLRALWRLNLAFPNEAPSRFGVALRSGNPRQLGGRVERVRRRGLGPTPLAAAESLLELVAALSAHDRQTRGHSERVRAYTELIAEELGLDPHACAALRWGGLIHDVGKLNVPPEILNKPGRLDDREWEIIRRHPRDGADLAEPMAGWLGQWADAVLDHHERWDGGGYPRGLAGEEISRAGRIVAVADAFDVMTSSRSYQRPRPHDEARAELVRCAGTHFDPAVVRAFLNISVRKVRTVIGPLAWLVQWPLFDWKLIQVARRVAPAAALATITGVAAITAPVDDVRAAADTEAVADLPGGSSEPAGATPAVPGDGSSPTALAHQSSRLDSFPVPGPTIELAHNRSDHVRGMPARDPGAGPGGPGGDDDGGGGSTNWASITIEPAEGSLEVADVGPADNDLPVIEISPAGFLLCDVGGVCEPIVVPLPLP